MVSSIRTDSPLSRSIVSSFLQFLRTVEAAPGQDTEGIEVAAQCLSEVFGTENQEREHQIRLVSLIDLFNSPAVQAIGGDEHVPTAPPPDIVGTTSRSAPPTATAGGPSSAGSGGQSVLDQFKDGLELAGFFEGTMQGTPEYEEKVKQAQGVLEEARKKIRSTTSPPKWSNAYSEDTLVLADAFKMQGNTAMSSNQYHAAIQMYTLALSLCSNNAIFHSNRAAALTAIEKFEEAIADCHAAMKLDPKYSKAYSRLGLVYFAQGRLQEAIEKGFKKALELDPTSTSVQENLRAAQSKLEDQQRSREPQDAPPQAPANEGPEVDIEANIANLLPELINMAQQFGQRAAQATTQQGAAPNETSGRTQSEQSGGGGSGAHQGDAEVTMDSSFNVSFNGQELPPQYAGLLQNAFQQLFGGSQGQSWPPGSTTNSNRPQGPSGPTGGS